MLRVNKTFLSGYNYLNRSDRQCPDQGDIHIRNILPSCDHSFLYKIMHCRTTINQSYGFRDHDASTVE
uniref:Uncharacterized protein n=1 Tax=Oryza brachyantha TaxID=4533 RepID=J3MEE3_ORYBR